LVTIINRNAQNNLTTTILTFSFSDALACSLSLVIAFYSLIGNINFFQLFILPIVGTVFYEINNLLFALLYIKDGGFGMRVVLFGSTFGFITSKIALQTQ
jgi:hypothetical protein